MSNTTQLELLTVKAINSKPKYPKFSNGSILTDADVWLNLSKTVKPEEFQKGSSYSVDIETNDKGYKTIVRVNAPATTQETSVKTFTPTENRTQYFEKKDESQKLGGLYHDAAQVAAAVIMAQGLTLDQALETFDKVLKHVVNTRNK